MIADNIEKINFKFNEELSQQISGILPKGHIYELGHPCYILLSTGFPDLPIELSSTRLEEKSIRNLVLALNDPIAVFLYGDERKAQNVIVELKNDNKNNSEWLNWITQRKALYLNKKKIQILIDQQRTDLADVEYLDLNLVESLVDAFVNPL